MPDWLKKLWAAVSTAEGVRGIITSPLVWPWVSGGVGAVLAWLDGYDKTVIYLSALAAFAFVGGGLYWFEERRARRTPENKLTIVSFNFFKDFVQPIQNEVKLDIVQLGITLHNTSDFPLSIILESVRNEVVRRVGGHIQRIQPQEIFAETRHILQPNGVVVARGKRIQLGGADCSLVEAELWYRIRYGHPGREKYNLTSPWARSVTAKFNPADGAPIGITWSMDAREPTQ
jgi:hypothetical protein